MKKHLSQIIVFLGFLLVVLGAFIDPMIVEEVVAKTTPKTEAEIKAALALARSTFVSPVTLINIAGVIALGFVFTKNKALVNIGYAMCGLLGANGLVYLIKVEFTIASIGQLIMLLGALVYLIMTLISFFGYVKGGRCDEEQADVSASLNSYKEMQTNGVITEEEFDTLKAKVLTSAKVDTVNDLKKWKKLLDQKVITEDEFAQIKSKIFKAQS